MTYVELRNAISEINIDVWHRAKSADDATDEIDGLIHDHTEARVREALEKAARVVMDAPITADMVNDDGAKALAIHANARIRDLIPK